MSEPIPHLFSDTPPIYFASLGSGSSGNCYYVEHDGTRLLIDAGVAPRTTSSHLKALGILPSSIDAILITHDHADHVKSIDLLAATYQLPIYTSPAVGASLAKSRHIATDISRLLRPMEVGQPFRLGSMEVRSFEVPHDATQNVGYTLRTAAGTFSLATDVGTATPEIAEVVRESNYLVFESNYDTLMLEQGTYPPLLKQRIASGTGHISNQASAEFIATHYHEGLKFLALCHLSKHNNDPRVAHRTMESRLYDEGIRAGKDIQLVVLERTAHSPLYPLYR